jgi:diguanylate cyclase (GGDEF)-like protein/PAS domain S-box-containing protein
VSTTRSTPLDTSFDMVGRTGLLAQITEVSADAIFSEDLDGAIMTWNSAAERLYGSSAEQMIGRKTTDLFTTETVTQLATAQDLARSGERVERFDTWHRRSDGRQVAVSLTVSPLRTAAGELAGVATSVQDVTERVRLATEIEDGHRTLEKSLAHKSLHDPLTDLPNRALMLDRLDQAISDADRHGLGVAVTHLDLHHYQRVNDQLGYHGADAMLVQVAERLQTRLRPGDTLARSSGDEFLVLWRDLDLDRPAEAVSLSEGLLRALDGPFDAADGSVTLSASAGVAYHTSGQSVEELLQSAAAATHDAKKRGSGSVVPFTEELREAAGLRRTLEVELRLALEGTITQFVLHYQPVVDLTSGRVVAVEALVRWQHPVRGLLGPDRFIPLSEATGLIHELGDWVLGTAIRDAAVLTHEARELDVAVNFSVLQLDEQAVAKVRRALENSGLRPGRLILEITESALVENEETTASTLEGLSDLGVKIAIDDFGTGYGSLLYLRRYPINTLKIDREFVAGIGESADDEAICGSITSLAAAVGASSVGEGVETMEQYAVLRSLGCLQGQGFLWSPAVGIDELGAAMASCDQVPVAAPRSRMARAPERLDTEVTVVIAKMHAEGASLHTIAAALNRTVGRHPRGVRWTANAVARGLPAEGVPLPA